MQPIHRSKKVNLHPLEAHPSSTEAPQAKRGRKALTFIDHVNAQNWDEVKLILDRSHLKEKIQLFRQIAEAPLSPSAVAQLDTLLLPVNMSAFLADYKLNPYEALVKHLKGCSAELHQLETETFNNRVKELNQRHKLQPDARLFAHVFADFIVKGPAFEGYKLSLTATYLNQILQIIKELNPVGKSNIHLEAALIKISALQKEAALMEKVTESFSEENLDRWSESKIKELRQTGNLYLRSGFAGENSGHAIVARIYKKNDRYSIMLFNTGDGLIYHPCRIIEGKRKYCTLAEWENLSKEDVENKMFFKAVFGMAMLKFHQGNTIKPSADNLYLTLMALAGEPKNHMDYADEQFMTPQRSGTCSWKCLMAFLKNTMPSNEYKRLKLQIRLVVFALTDSRVIDEEFASFYAQTHAKIFRSVNKLYERNLISTRQLFEAYLVFSSKSPSSQDRYNKTEVTVKKKAPTIVQKKKSDKLKPISPPLGPIKPIPQSLSEPWSHLLPQFEIACAHMEALFNDYRLPELRQSLKLVLTKMPQVNDACWKEMSFEEIETCSNNLIRLVVLIKNSGLEFTPERVVNSYYLYQLHSTLVYDYMNRKAGRDVFDNGRMLFKEMSQVLDMPLNTTDPVVIDRMHHLTTFLSESRKEDDFLFEIERNHLGTMIVSCFDCDEKYEKGFNLILKNYLIGIGQKSKIPKSNFQAYADIFKRKTHFPAVFWDLFHHLCLGLLSGLSTIKELDCDICAEEGDLFFPMKLWSKSGEEEKPLIFSLPDQLDEAKIATVNNIKPTPFYFQVPAVLDLLASKNEILRKKDMELLTVSLFQAGKQEPLDTELPIVHENKRGGSQLQRSKLQQIIERQLKYVLLCGEIEQLEELYDLCCTIDHYIGFPRENQFQNLITYPQVASFCEKLKEEHQVEGALFFLRFAQRNNTINHHFLEVYLRTFFKTYLSFNRDRYVACCLIGNQLSSRLSLEFEKDRSKIDELLREITGIEGAVTGYWPEVRLGGFTFNFCTGLQLSPSGEVIYCLKKTNTPKGLQEVLNDDHYPLSLRLEENKLFNSAMEIGLEYYKGLPPFELISGKLLQSLTKHTLPILCSKGYTKNSRIYSGLHHWSPDQIKNGWFACDGSHAYTICADKEILLHTSGKKKSKCIDVLRGLEQIDSLPSTVTSTHLKKWIVGAKSLWYHPENHHVHFLNELRFIWDPKTDGITCDDYSDYRIADKQLDFVSIVLEKNPHERLFILLKESEKAQTIILTSDPEVTAIEKSIAGPPSDMIVLVTTLMCKYHFSLAHYYYKKIPKLIHDTFTWRWIDSTIHSSALFKTNNPDFFALLVLMAFDILESNLSIEQNEQLFSRKKFEKIYDTYVQNYSNTTIEMRLSPQQEEFIQSHLEPSSLWTAHLNKLKGVPQKSVDQPELEVKLLSSLDPVKSEWSFVEMIDTQALVRFDKAEEDSEEEENNSDIIPYTRINYYFDQSETKNLVKICKTLIHAIDQKDRDLKIHAMALLAAYKSSYKSVRDPEMENHNKHLFWLAFNLAKNASDANVTAFVQKIKKESSYFKNLLNQLFVFLKKRSERGVVPMVFSKTEVPPALTFDSSTDAEMSTHSENSSSRFQPFFKDFKTFFEEEPSSPLAIQELLTAAHSKSDRAGQFLLDILRKHAESTPTPIYRLKEGKRTELVSNLETQETLLRSHVEQRLAQYRESVEGSLEKDFTSHLRHQVKILGRIEKRVCLQSLSEDYFLSNRSHNRETKALIESIVCLQLEAQICRLAIAALKEGNDLLAGQVLCSALPAVNEGHDMRVRVQSFYQIISNKLFRVKQWKVFDFNAHHSSLALQVDCGEGKTKVITVALALEQLMRRKLVFNVVPSGNAETNVCDLVSVISAKTPFRVRHFEVTRAFKTDVHHLRQFSHSLALNEQEGVALVGIPQSIQSLLLKYFEALIEPVSGDERIEQEQKLYLFEESLDRIMRSAKGICDEAHDVLSPKRTLNYTLNSEDQGVPVERYQDIVWLFEAIVASKSYEMPFPVGSDHAIPWTQEYYHAEQKPYLADIWSQLFPQEEQAQIRSILEKRPEEMSESEKAFFSSKNEKNKDRLLLMRAQLHYYLPYTLRLRCCVNYGLLEGVKEAVPYDYNQSPLKNSKFQNPDISINLSLLQTLQLDLKREQLKEIVSVLQKTGTQSEEVQKAFPFEIQALNLENSVILDELYTHYKSNHLLKREYARLCVLPTILMQNERLSSTAHDLGALLFPQVTSFTGTLLSHFLMLPARMHYELDSAADAAMLRTFLQGDHVEISEESLNSLMGHPLVSMVLDPNAYFEGRFNRDVATSLLSECPASVTAIAYFDDESNLIKRLTRGSSEGRVVTYCDQKHTVGTDTVQPKDAIGLLIVHLGMTWTDFVQAAKRLRQLGRGQKVILAVSPEMKAIITQKFPDGPFNKEKVFLWACLNEGAKVSSSFYLSLQQQLHTICRRRLMHKLMRIRFEENSYDKRIALVSAYRALIVEKVNNHEYREHGSIEPAKTPLAQFSESVKHYTSEFKDLLTQDDLAEIQAMARVAETFLSDEPLQAVNDRLTMHMQTEKREVRLLAEDTESHTTQLPLIKDAEAVLKNCKLVDPFTMFPLQNKVYLSAGYDPKIGLDNRLMFTSSLVHKKVVASLNQKKAWNDSLKNHRFNLCFPKIEYIMQLGEGGRRRYFTIIKNEADVLRRFAHTQTRKSDYVSQLVIFNTEGQKWLDYSNHKMDEDPDRALISAQVRFINAEVSYTSEQMLALRKWLGAGDLEAKIAFFIARQTHLANTDESIRFRDPAIMQAFFNDCRDFRLI